MNSIVAFPIVGALPIAGGGGGASGDAEVFKLIADHKTSIAEVDRLVGVVSQLEDELPEAKRKSDTFCWNLKLEQTDDPRWIDTTQRYHDELVRADELACQMVSIEPQSVAGAAALLKYAAEHIAAGYVWPTELEVEGGGFGRGWLYFLTENLATSLQRLAA